MAAEDLIIILGHMTHWEEANDRKKSSKPVTQKALDNIQLAIYLALCSKLAQAVNTNKSLDK